MFSILGNYINYFASAIKKNNIVIRGLLLKSYKNKKSFEDIYGTELQYGKLGFHQVSCTLYNDILAFHIYEDEPKAIIIKNKIIVNLMKDVFKRM